jgi:hypothetical protein
MPIFVSRTMEPHFCVAHYGANAREKVTSRAEQLARQGDADGERIWRAVAREVEKTTPKSLPLSWSAHV